MYNNAAEKVDELAERILMLGGEPENKFSEYLKVALSLIHIFFQLLRFHLPVPHGYPCVGDFSPYQGEGEGYRPGLDPPLFQTQARDGLALIHI